MARCGRNKRNACRNLHTLIHRTGRTLPVKVSAIPSKVMVVSGKPKVVTVNFPILLPSAWAETLFKEGGHVLLGGHHVSDVDGYGAMFKDFWSRFQAVRPDHNIFEQDYDHRFCIPYGYHGDEGRGKTRKPVMVLSWQPIMSHRGPRCTNSSGFLG